MAKRFEPNRRLLKILVGSNLYGSPDACIRELLQNAWDAIQLRKKQADGNGGQITVAYSISKGWFEVIDDGIGMDQKTIEDSFFEIGQNKLEVLGLAESVSQIGYFGIGVLSVFLLADNFEVFTKSVDPNKPAIHFKVTGIDDPVEFSEHEQRNPGTRIRVFPKDRDTTLASLPDVVRSYARHVAGVFLHSVDDNIRKPLTDMWAIDNLLSIRDVDGISSIRSGRIGFLPALRKDSETLENQITICNAGFLVEEAVADLVSTTTIGIGGEIDLKPSAINIGMSRERIQRDDRWFQLGKQLQTFFIQAALDELEMGELKRLPELDSDEVKRNILLWYHFLPPEPPFSELYETLDLRVFETLPFSQVERSPTTLANLLEECRHLEKLYFRQIGSRRQRTQTIDDDGLPIRFYQEIRDSVRIGALRAKGFSVIELNQHQVNIRTENTVQTLQIQEQPLIQKCLDKRGLQLINIVNAPDSDMDLRSIEKLPILQSALTMPGGLRFASVPDSKRRIISDETGMRYINLRSPSVQNLLKLIPDATSNPLKHKLLEVYLRLEDFKLADAREILVDLLKSENLATLAQAEMAPLTKKYVDSLICELLQGLES